MDKWVEFIEKCIKNNRNIVIVGEAGTGKVTRTRQVIEDMGETIDEIDCDFKVDFDKIEKDKITIIDGFFTTRFNESWEEKHMNIRKMYDTLDSSIRGSYKGKSIIFTATSDEIKMSLEKPLLDRCIIIDIEPLK